MPQVISGPRRARSFVTPGAAVVVSRVLDFNFAANQGIEVTAVLGFGKALDPTPAPSDTVPADVYAQQTLHLEEGTVEDFPIAGADDADEIDTEVFFAQSFGGMFQTGTTNTFGAGGGAPADNLYIPYRDPILVARNITHRGETIGASTGSFGVLIFYHYVVFSNAELGLILARRQ